MPEYFVSSPVNHHLRKFYCFKNYATKDAG
jgi:hypothetical protein